MMFVEKVKVIGKLGKGVMAILLMHCTSIASNQLGKVILFVIIISAINMGCECIVLWLHYHQPQLILWSLVCDLYFFGTHSCHSVWLCWRLSMSW